VVLLGRKEVLTWMLRYPMYNNQVLPVFYEYNNVHDVTYNNAYDVKYNNVDDVKILTAQPYTENNYS
jgi:hypothetical protein